MQIYVVERPDGQVKIGKSGNPTRRINSLENMGGFRSASAWISIPGTFDDKAEGRAHVALDNRRTVGEWFDVSFDHAVATVIENGTPPSISMDVSTDAIPVRQANLDILLKRYKRSQLFANATGLAPAHVSQLKHRVRTMGEGVARRIEGSLSLPHGWMDQNHDDTTETGTEQQYVDDGEMRSITNLLSQLSKAHRQQALQMISDFVKSCQ